ncbi:MAG: hypothetical protein RL021_1977 [Bacteroidota bacterium]|jgi:hypothetical protein
MKRILLSFFIAGAIFVSTASRLRAQNADVQVIHNCADTNAQLVDIYVNGALTLDDFAFRTATNFISLPAALPYQVGIAPSTSTSVADVIANFNLTLQSGHRYVVMATGVLDTVSYAANPDGRSIAFDLVVQDNISPASADTNNVDIIVMHGSTDAPTVDVVPVGTSTPAVDNAAFRDFSAYLNLPATSLSLNLTPGNDNSNILASYIADLTGLGGGSAVVFASGFLDPSTNQNGAAFGLFAALPSGAVIQLPENTNALLQVIHNAADPAADTVDIYADGSLLLDDFVFRQATPYIEVPAGAPLNIAVAPGTSTSVADTITSFTVTLQPGQTYVAVANGVLDTTAFSVNPSSQSIAFNLWLRSGMTTASASSGTVDLTALHGATDALTVDVLLQSVATPLIDGLTYGEFSSTLTVGANAYVLNVTPSSFNNVILASYDADLTAAGGASAVLFASGFLNPAANNGGSAFGLFAAFADGSVIELPAHNSARVQVIHNAADVIADSVDVYAGAVLLIPGFAYRTATPFVEVPAGQPIQIGIALANSTSAADTIAGLGTTLNLTPGQTYIILANGVTDPAQYAANPDGRSTAFQFIVKENVREQAAVAGEVDFFIVHGCTDAPTVDVLANNTITLADNAAYTDATGYLNVPAASYTIGITPAAGTPVLLEYTADLTTLGGQSAVVFASGFLTPSANQNGSAFGLYAALTDGTVIPFQQLINGVSDATVETFSAVYPNPASGELRVVAMSDFTGKTTCTVSDAFGRIVSMNPIELRGRNGRIDVSGLPNGVYHLTLTAEDRQVRASFVIAR